MARSRRSGSRMVDAQPPTRSVDGMRNLLSAVVNWVAALFASGSGAPHPIAATDTADRPRKPAKARKPKRRRR